MAEGSRGEQRAPVKSEESEHEHSGSLEKKYCMKDKEDGEPYEEPVES